MGLIRYSKNPLLTPSSNWWETLATFNPGAAVFEDKIYLVYRALGGDGLSRFGLAVSSDGENFDRFADPILEADPENPYERLGIEDARISKIDDTFYIVYTSPSVYPAKTFRQRSFAPSLSHLAPWRVRPALFTTKDFQTFERKGILLNEDSKDALLLPEKINNQFVLYHRVYPNVYITYSQDLKKWENEKIILQPRSGFWDSERVGMGAPPVKTSKGWLALYHAVDQDHRYQLGLMLLDLADPSKVLYRSPEAIFKPQEDYETKGMVPNVVFTCGVVEREGKLLVYYGGADTVVALAYLDLKELTF